MAHLHSLRSSRTRFRRSAGVAAAAAVAALIAPAAAEATTASFTSTGLHPFLVPPGVTQITIDVAGGGGGSDSSGNGCKPGAGAHFQGTIPVAQGTRLTIDVGGRGGDASPGGAGGAGGDAGDLPGAPGGTAGDSSPTGGGGGGGASLIASPAAGTLVVAGGGGGCGGFANGAGAGDGGDHGAPGGAGLQNAEGGAPGTSGGDGAGGASVPSSEPGGSAGHAGAGGAGASAPGLHFGGGGGGGGNRGGGGGGGADHFMGAAGGGGGGGDLVPAGVMPALPEESGNGHVTISYTSSWNGTVVGDIFVPTRTFTLGNYGHWTLLQTGVDPGSRWIVPGSGVITSWGYETASGVPDSIELKVGRGQRDGLGGGDFAIVASSPAGTLVPNQLNTFAVRIPVQAGDVLGSYQGGPFGYYETTNSFPEYTARATGDAAPGSTHHFDDTSGDTGVKVPIVALLEPDAEGDGFGDTSQDACLGTFGTANGCPNADLALTATPNATSVTVGQDVIYTLQVSNNGPDPAAASITDALPAGAKFLGAVSNAGTCVAGPPVKCDLGPVASGHSATATVIVEATQAGALLNTATVSGPTVPAGVGAGDPNPANDSATASTDVLAAGGSPGGGSPGGGSPGGGNPGGGGTPGTTVFKGVTIKIKHGTITVAKGTAHVTLACAVAAKGQLNLTAVTGRGKKRKTISLGHAAFTIRAGKVRVVALRLTTRALKLLTTRGGAMKVLAVAAATNNSGAKKTNHARATLKLAARPR